MLRHFLFRRVISSRRRGIYLTRQNKKSLGKTVPCFVSLLAVRKCEKLVFVYTVNKCQFVSASKQNSFLSEIIISELTVNWPPLSRFQFFTKNVLNHHAIRSYFNLFSLPHILYNLRLFEQFIWWNLLHI